MRIYARDCFYPSLLTLKNGKQSFKKNEKNVITHNQQVNPINEIIFTHKCQEN